MNCSLLPENEPCNHFNRRDVPVPNKKPKTDYSSTPVTCRNCHCNSSSFLTLSGNENQNVFQSVRIPIRLPNHVRRDWNMIF